MNASFKKSLIVVAVATLSLVFVASLWAQSYLDGSSKARGDYGQMSRSWSTPSYRVTTPSRSFSYEPAPAVKTDKSDSTKVKSNASPKASDNSTAKAKDNTSANANAAPNATAQRNSQSTRQFSYEPSMGVTNSRRSSSTPLYLVPKTLR